MAFSFSVVFLILDLILFTIFIISVFVKIGIPDNLSTTYYLYQDIRKGTGWYFPSLIVFICFTGILVWISSTYHASSWGSKFTILPVITLLCLLAVAASAKYKKNKKLINFHYSVAIVGAVCSVAWINLVAYKLIPVGMIILLASIFAGIRTKTLKSCPLFWLEIAWFYALLILVLLIVIIPVEI